MDIRGVSAPWITRLAVFLLLVLPQTVFAQISPSSPPLNPPMWSTDPTVTGTNDWDDWKRNCADLYQHPGFGTLFSCGASTFRSRPFHFLAQTVVPGSAVGGGGFYGRDFNQDIWQNRLELTGVLTIREFWFTEAKFTAQRPHFGSFHSDENLALQVYARNRQLPAMPFYGLGPNSNVNNSGGYSERDTRLGVLVASPLASWLGISGTIESLWPNIGSVTEKNVVPIDQIYTEQTAPGLTSQPHFFHYEAFLRPHFAVASGRIQFDYRFRYAYFQDTSTGHYSFQRFVSDFGHSIYPETENGHRRLDSVITVRCRISMSAAGRSNAIPFYLQETMGGSNIDNEPTVRSFRDYRFTGPNTFLTQVEYDRRIWGPIGLLAFYDAGKVTFSHGDLNFSNLRQGFGGGMSFFLAGKIVFRAYVGLGSSEGAHPYFGIANFL